MSTLLRSVALAVALAAILSFFFVAPARATNVTTVITHGFQAASGVVPDWVSTMAKAILERDAGAPQCGPSAPALPVGTVLHYTPDTLVANTPPYTGTWQIDCGSLTANGPIVLIFDWARESDVNLGGAQGFAEAAADVLYAALRDPRLPPGWESVDLLASDLHFIGHSRGTVVHSETVERLTVAGVDVDHVTSIDPHPVNGTLPDEQVVVPAPPAWGDDPPQVWGRSSPSEPWGHVVFADNYYRADQGVDSPGRFHSVDFDGTRLPWNPGAVTQAPLQADHQVETDCNIFDLGVPNESGDLDSALADLNDLALDHEHSKIHAWYHGTIDTTASDDGTVPTATPIDPAMDHPWYQDRPFPNMATHPCVPKRDETGYGFSRIGLATGSGLTRAVTGDRERPGVAGTSPSAGYSPLSIYNGDFEVVDELIVVGLGHAGWRYQGGNRMLTELWNGNWANFYFRMNAARSPLTHNWLYIDGAVTHLYVHLRVPAPASGTLHIDFIDQTGVSVESIAAHNVLAPHGWTEFSFPVSTSLGQSYRLEFSYVGVGSVDIDNIAFEPLPLNVPGPRGGWLGLMVAFLLIAGSLAFRPVPRAGGRSV